MNTIYIDFETYGGVSLPDHGLFNYVNNPTFKPLSATYISESNMFRTFVFDFVLNPKSIQHFTNWVRDADIIVAHNAAFEQAVLVAMGIDVSEKTFIDTAALARRAGAASSLENASRQLLSSNKVAAGSKYIQKFCVPGEYQVRNGSLMFDPQIALDNPNDWEDFVWNYGRQDVMLAADLRDAIRMGFAEREFDREQRFWKLTNQINLNGWHVDLEMVDLIQERYRLNNEHLRSRYPDLNFNSTPQLKKYCADRGVIAKSFDELNVKKLFKKIQLRNKNHHRAEYDEVLSMLYVKQALGGSSLSKLDKIKNNISDDHRLYNQYLHFGAGQTGRTSGQTVQMQNLKRLSDTLISLDDLKDEEKYFSNADLATNLRQVFTASDPNGRIICADYSAIESRALAWLADEEWKIQAYKDGRDVYTEQGARMKKIELEAAVPETRKEGKLGELSCGYGAGPPAVKDFAEKLGTILTDQQAMSMVTDWRDACPNTVYLWQQLRDALLYSVKHQTMQTVPVGPASSRGIVYFHHAPAARSLGTGSTITMMFTGPNPRASSFTRVFHGVHLVGNEIRYYKPSSNKTGEPWSATYLNPKTKRREHHKLHGGKLAGILTQSLCREIFFRGALEVQEYLRLRHPHAMLVGQFHDELNIDVAPPGGADPHVYFQDLEEDIKRLMSHTPMIPDLPMAASVASAYRYTK